jgi:hypothetical protein
VNGVTQGGALCLASREGLKQPPSPQCIMRGPLTSAAASIHPNYSQLCMPPATPPCRYRDGLAGTQHWLQAEDCPLCSVTRQPQYCPIKWHMTVLRAAQETA